MSKKTLNQANLAQLGADRLAHLLIEVSTGSAEIKRRLRLELSHNLGPLELARDVRKRLVSIRKSSSFVSWRKRKVLIRDLTTQAQMIIEKIAPDAPSEGFDLLWLFMELAPSVYNRVDDNRGDVSAVFRTALQAFADIAPNAGLEPKILAARVWDALRGNEYGEFDGSIALLAPTLGEDGLTHLKTLVEAYDTAPQEDSEDHAALQFLRDLRSGSGNFAADQKARLVTSCLQQIAAARGDIDAYIAQYSDHALTRPAIAAEVAELLLGDARPAQALDALTMAQDRQGTPDSAAWDAAYIACLLALDRVDEAQTHRWIRFCDTLDAQHLRDYLRMLPDFEDIEAEDAAKAHALQFDNMIRALMFFLDWPDLRYAAQLIEARATELDGNLYEVLTPAAEALRNRHPLAAVVVWRSMVEHALFEGRATRYGHAAGHLMDCAAADMEISDYGGFQPHGHYVDGLRQRHQHKASFWARVP